MSSYLFFFVAFSYVQFVAALFQVARFVKIYIDISDDLHLEGFPLNSNSQGDSNPPGEWFKPRPFLSP